MPHFPASPHRRVRAPLLLQPEPLGCGPAALWIMLGYFGKFVPLEELRETLSVARDGIRLTDLIRAARHYGLEAKVYRKTITDLPQLKPPFLLYWGFNHYVIVEGCGRDAIHLNDPAVGRRTVAYAELNLRFTGIVAVLQPGAGFQAGGERPSVWRLLRQRCRGLELALASQFAVSLLLPLPVLFSFLLLRNFMDGYIQARSAISPMLLLTGMGLAALLQAALTCLQQRAQERQGAQLATTWCQQCFAKLLRLPLPYQVQQGSAAPLELARGNEDIAQFLTEDAPNAVAHIATLLLGGALMLWWSPLLAGVAFCCALLIGLAHWADNAVRRERAGRLIGESARLASSQLSVLADMEHVQLNGGSDNAFKRITGLQAKLLNMQTAQGILPEALLALPGFMTALALDSILALGMIEVMQANLSLGTLVVFQGLLLYFLAPVGPLLHLASRLRGIGQMLADLDYVARYPNPTETNAAPSHSPQGHLELKAVTFGYSHLYPPLIENLNLALAPGQQVALVGANGSGKSTIGRLIGRLYEPWSGAIRFDGKALADTVAGGVGLVTGDNFFVAGTLRENMRLGDTELSEANLDAALRDACLEELLLRRGGWDTFIAADGANLSGGQRQRLAIARVLARQPALLVLDESTNSLDPVTERQLHHNLRQRGCSCLIISHRLSAIQGCDEIIVLAQGAIAQRGHHAQLACQDGVYRQLLQGDMVTNKQALIMPNEVATDALQFEKSRLASRLNQDAIHSHRSEPFLVTWRWLPKGLLFHLQVPAKDLATLAVLTTLEALLLLLPCLAIGLAVGAILPGGNTRAALGLGLALGVGAVSGLALNLTRNLALTRLQTRLDSCALKAVWASLLRSPAVLLRRYTALQLYEQTGAIQTSVVAGAAAMTELLSSGWLALLCVVIICCLQPRLALLALCLMLPHVVSALGEAALQAKRMAPLEAAFNAEATTATVLFVALPTLRLLGQEQWALARWHDKFASRQQLMAQTSQTANHFACLETAWSLLTPAIFLACAATAELRPASLLMLFVVFWQLQAATQKWRDSWLRSGTHRATLQHTAPLLQAIPASVNGQLNPGRLQGAIEWRDVTFRYAETLPLVLDNLSLKIKAGEFVGIVGASGAGKSTLFRLALGLETPDEGTLCYDGHALAELDLTLLRQQMGVMLQTSKLVAGDIKSILLGASSLPLERAWAALRLVGLEENIQRLPMGMKTFVAEGGANFSAAQQQLLLLARALVNQPAMLFLDEAAGHLDHARDNHLARALESLTMTRLVITHRYSTIRHADRIIVLADGHIVQSGTFEELMAEAGPFRALNAKPR